MPPKSNKFNKSKKIAHAEVKPTSGNTSPISSVPKLYYNKLRGHSKVLLWEKSMYTHLGTKCGIVAEFMETGQKFQIPAIAQPQADSLSQQNDPHGIKLKEYQTRCKCRFEQEIRNEQVLPMVCIKHFSTWIRESEEMTKQDVDFRAAGLAKDPVLLLPIWR